LSKEAIRLGAKNTEGNPLFDFGVDLQWEVAKFEHGTKRCYVDFRISLPVGLRVDSEHLPLGTERQFVDGFVKVWGFFSTLVYCSFLPYFVCSSLGL